jgi:hypothetical protein
MDVKDILSLLFGFAAVAGVLGGLANRFVLKRGIGGQFIRYSALMVGLPLSGSLIFQGQVTESVVTLILGVLGYIFPVKGGKG